MTVLLHRSSLPLRRYATSIFPSPFLSTLFSTDASSPPSISRSSQLLPKLRKTGIDEVFIQHLQNESKPFLMDSSWQKIHLLMAEGVSVHQLNLFLRKCGPQVDECFVRPPLHRLAAALALFKSVHVDKQNLGTIFIRHKSLLKKNTECLEAKFTILQNLGIERKDLGKIFVKCPKVFNLSDDIWQRRLHFWQKLGVPDESICKMMRIQPQKLRLSCDKYLEPLITHFERYGISKDVVALTLIRYPGCLGLSMENLSRKMEFLQNLGFKKDSIRIMRVYCDVGALSLGALQSRVDWLMNKGFSVDEVRHLVRNYPSLLRKKTESTEQTLDYLLNVLKLDLKDIIHFPQCLLYSLEKRIKPRIAFLAETGVHKFTALSSILHCTDAAFEKKFTSIKSIKDYVHMEDTLTEKQASHMEL